jgi:hypothetical protein
MELNRETLVALARAGHVPQRPSRIVVPRYAGEIARVRISEAGRRALGDQANGDREVNYHGRLVTYLGAARAENPFTQDDWPDASGQDICVGRQSRRS